MTERILTPVEAAHYLGVSKQTLNVWRMTGRHKLPFIKIGRLVRYREADLRNFIESRMKG
ncbi:Helix-turn-helix domain protein [compost metagenome]